ncbi:MAG: T9SS type A sorting domain-containing protein [Saprospiraceae bacterium]|nr:T9SS type A sorting domain-containing protein [Saprospiraceae bacterium]
MKRILLLSIVIFSIGKSLIAQTCTPDRTLPDSVVIFPLPFSETNPMGGINDTACIGEPFEFAVTVNVPATFASPFGTVPINSIDMATDGAIRKIPVGIDYVCNPPNCIFPKDSSGCILLFGTVNDTAGVYDVAIDFVIQSVIAFPISFPNPSLFPGNYYLHVKPNGECVTSTDDLADLGVSTKVRPNPFSGFAQIVINTPISGNFDFTVTDLLGRKIRRERVNLIVGENTIDFDGSELAAGVYIYTLSDGERQLSDKMIVQKN